MSIGFYLQGQSLRKEVVVGRIENNVVSVQVVDQLDLSSLTKLHVIYFNFNQPHTFSSGHNTLTISTIFFLTLTTLTLTFIEKEQKSGLAVKIKSANVCVNC